MSGVDSEQFREALKAWVRRVDAAHAGRDGNPATLAHAFRAGWDARPLPAPSTPNMKEAVESMSTQEANCFSLFSGLCGSMTVVFSVEEVQKCIELLAASPHFFRTLMDITSSSAHVNKHDLARRMDRPGPTGVVPPEE